MAQTLAGIQQEINGSNLTDGQSIKQLLLDVVAYCTSSAALPAATTTVAGAVKEAADVATTANTNGVGAGAGIVAAAAQAQTDANFTLLTNQINSILANMKAAGQMA